MLGTPVSYKLERGMSHLLYTDEQCTHLHLTE